MKEPNTELDVQILHEAEQLKRSGRVLLLIGLLIFSILLPLSQYDVAAAEPCEGFEIRI